MKDFTPLTILKLGGSLITKKDAARPTLARARLKRICKEIAAARPNDDRCNGKLILVHGAGSYGHPAVKSSRIDKGIRNKKQLASFAEVQRLQNELNVEVCRELQEAGVPAFPLQASVLAYMRRGRLQGMDSTPIKRCLELGLVPVLFGTPAFDAVQDCSILSGDEIAAHLAKSLKARVVLASDTEILDSSNKIMPRLDRKNISQIKKMHNSKADVTGGMAGKLKTFLRYGVRCEIINGNRRDYIKRALKGESGLGTISLFELPSQRG